MDSLKSVDEEILEYLPHLNSRQKQTVLTVVKTFAEEQDDWWAELGEEQEGAIKKALAEVAVGEVIPHEEVMQKYNKWRKTL